MAKRGRKKSNTNTMKANFRKAKDTLELEPGEKLVHCLDKKSFEGKYYNPNWAVSNYGRVYSLCDNDWITPVVIGKYQKYWAINGGTKRNGMVYIHLLVANYFCNKRIFDDFPADEIEVHHKKAIIIPKKVKYADKEKRIKHCMEYNNAANLAYTYKLDHDIITALANGQNIKDIKGIKLEFPEEIKQMFQLGKPSSDIVKDALPKSVYVDYTKEGEALYHAEFTIKGDNHKWTLEEILEDMKKSFDKIGRVKSVTL